MSRDGHRRRTLTYEERVLWTAVTKAIKPLRDLPLPPPGEALAENPEAATRPLSPPKFLKPAKAPGIAPAAPQEQQPKTPLSPLAPLGRRMKRSVARGKESIDARLDLHGLTQAQAHGALLRFLRAASARDARLVLVITGKGKRGEGDDRERGVLRRQVPQWLSLPEFRPYVLGFEDAHIAHGGEGALYVRVRRVKPA
jgi:DNA-nicking Smr family endonuclease